MKNIKHYILEVLVFGFIFVIFMVDLNPDYTFINKAADSIGYLYSAKYLFPSYHTSPPLYLLVSHFFLMLPFGTEAWRMGLVSVLSSMGACVFIYLTLRKLIPEKKLYALLGVLIYGTSALVISQTVVVQTYATVCMTATGAYYFAICKRWKLMGLMIGIGLAVHILMAFVFAIMFMAFKEYRKNWKALAITLSFGIFYLYMPLTNRPPYMWFANPHGSIINSVWYFVTDTWLTIVFLLGKLSIWDFPKRILDTVGILLISIGVVTIIPIIYYFKGKKLSKNVLFWLVMFPIVLFVSELDMNTFDYLMVSIPFLAIVACLGIDARVRSFSRSRFFILCVFAWVIGFGVFNANYFDIGRTLDPNLSAVELYNVELAKIPDGAIFMPNAAMVWEATYKYNADYDRHIIPICRDSLSNKTYQQQLLDDGIKLIGSENENGSIASTETARSIVALNENVWTTIVVEPTTFKFKVVPTNGDGMLIEGLDVATERYIATHPQWKWKPWNPYDILTTRIAETEWKNQLLSNWNVMFFTEIGALGLFLNWLIWKIINRGKTNEVAISEPKEN